jgi:hypothetical protein
MPDPLAVLLLPVSLEEFELEDHARDLLRAPRVVALEPPRVSWTRLAKLPDVLATGAALRSAKRIKLPGKPRVVILYHPLQARLALALLARNKDAELWYVRHRERDPDPDPELERRIGDLDASARRRATLDLTLDELAPLPPARSWFEANGLLWDRLEELGVAEFK